MNTTSKQFWTRIILLSLIPIFLGMAGGVIFMEQSENRSDQDIEIIIAKKNTKIAYRDSIINQLNAEVDLLNQFGQFPQLAKEELKIFKAKLDELREPSTLGEVDSLESICLSQIKLLPLTIDTFKSYASLRNILFDNFSTQARQISRSMKKGIIVESDNEKRDDVIYVLENNKNELSSKVDELKRQKDKLESELNKLKTLNGQIKSKLGNRISPDDCNHEKCVSDCEYKKNIAILKSEKHKIENFLGELKGIDNLTGWILDSNIKDKIAEIEENWHEVLKKIEVKLETVY